VGNFARSCHTREGRSVDETPTRIEHILIRLELDKSAYDRHKADVDRLCGLFYQAINNGDTLKVSYDFCATYFGDVGASLEAVSRILDDEKIITHASVYELQRGRSIIVGVVEKLTRIIDKLENKSNERPSWKKRIHRLVSWS
jgi:hypothetical protein